MVRKERESDGSGPPVEPERNPTGSVMQDETYALCMMFVHTTACNLADAPMAAFIERHAVVDPAHQDLHMALLSFAKQLKACQKSAIRLRDLFEAAATAEGDGPTIILPE